MCLVFFHIVIKKMDSDLITESLTFFDKLVSQIEVLKIHIDENLSNTNEIPVFKFGFEFVNCIANVMDYKISLVVVLLTGSVAHLVKENYKATLNYLLIAEKIRCPPSYSFVIKYLKAYCHLYLEQGNETEFLLASITSEPMSNFCKSHYYQLLGSLHSQRDKHEEAISYFEKAVETGEHVPSALLLAANEAEDLGLPSVRCVFLKNLINVLKDDSKILSVFHMRSFPERCLAALHPDPVVTLSEAYYLLAKEALIAQHYIASSENYSELLLTLKSNYSIVVSEERPAPLPKTAVIYHEAALVNLKISNFDEALHLCDHMISNHSPTINQYRQFGIKRKLSSDFNSQEQDWNNIVSSMDEDVIALILASDVLVQKNDYTQAFDHLEKCFNSILEYKNYNIPQKRPRVETGVPIDKINLLCNCLLAKVLLRKAKINETKNLTDSVYHFYRRALQFSPGDEEVLYNFKIFSQKNTDKDPFILPQKQDVVPVEELQSCALKYILESSVKNEEPTKIVEPECFIDDDIVNSLFDD